jgi:putative N6-adenine-specific DNA methylase
LLPGMDRSFAFEHWPSHDKKIWMALKEEGRTQKLGADPGVVFMGTDRDKGAIQAASSNAQRAHVAQQTQFRICDFQDLTPPVDTGLVIVNPPYGKRVGGSDPKRIFRTIGQTLQGRWQGWRVAMLVPERRWMGLLGADVEEIASFSNGGVRVHLVCGRVR